MALDPLPYETPVTERDLDIFTQQLGRPMRAAVSVARRCVCGHPAVVRTAPRLPDGTPFPTSFYLTLPAATASCSTLESAGIMRDWTARLETDLDLALAYNAAHERYLARRAELGECSEIDGISAGGMPTRVKCIHVLVGHALAEGPGVNPLGDEALRVLAATWSIDRCQCSETTEHSTEGA
ncbi:DUF501 domain-containing protein [Micrococcales bacterium 31B]|nr:DUF501 domain-containing protein [Micrococcales bacterium 31B]